MLKNIVFRKDVLRRGTVLVKKWCQQRVCIVLKKNWISVDMETRPHEHKAQSL
ncbi:hypothetical protein E2C01_061905 [Portunus trituberculatus]|uniref:Uncharacterized protein n=1 Tax=Portunus trituberculatus TaxID=210409 RepID=A0A5B7HC89_PORTR|nr:hypothetical protein [Portunus trituberculatus]